MKNISLIFFGNAQPMFILSDFKTNFSLLNFNITLQNFSYSANELSIKKG